MSWCSRAALVLSVGFVLACGGGGADEEALEKALMESRLREANMRAELAEAKAQGSDASTEKDGPASSTTKPGQKSSDPVKVPSSASGGSAEEPDHELDRLLMQQDVKKRADSSNDTRKAGSAEAASSEDLLGDFDDLDDDGSGGGLGAKLRDAVGSEVTVEGDARVVLVSSKGERVQLPAKVPPGKYDIEATFSGRAPVIVGTTAVKVGSNSVISCNPRMFICRAQ